jgi:23S rRNA (guanosine2251-2'-O)-methyltransferase
MTEWLYGRNAIYESLRASRRDFKELLIAEGVKQQSRIKQILDLCSQSAVQIKHVPRSRLDGLGVNHQGVALKASAYPYLLPADFLEHVRHSGNKPLILILDSLNDPQNLGTLLRTAEAVAVDGVLLPLRRTATVTPAVVNASSGATEYLKITRINLAQGIRSLKEIGVWVMGLDSSPGARDITEVDLDVPLALVVGSESSGLRSLVQKSCDRILRLPMCGKIDSLNASVAGSIALYLAWQRKAS